MIPEVAVFSGLFMIFDVQPVYFCNNYRFLRPGEQYNTTSAIKKHLLHSFENLTEVVSKADFANAVRCKRTIIFSTYKILHQALSKAGKKIHIDFKGVLDRIFFMINFLAVKKVLTF